MQARDAVFLEDLCPKLRARRWRRSLHQVTDGQCLYCGRPSESIDHVHPLSRGGISATENCVPGNADAFDWYRRQSFYDPRRAMALRAWVEGDLRLALRLLQWSLPGRQQAGGSGQTANGSAVNSSAINSAAVNSSAGNSAAGNSAAGKAAATDDGREASGPMTPSTTRSPAHQTRQAAAPLWRWQMAS
jgi:hypothetical protein